LNKNGYSSTILNKACKMPTVPQALLAVYFI